MRLGVEAANLRWRCFACEDDSGRFVFNPYDPKISLVLPGPISSEAPIDDEALATGKASNTLGPTTLGVGGVLAARFRNGVVEHVLTPESGEGSVLRVVTSSRVSMARRPS